MKNIITIALLLLASCAPIKSVHKEYVHKKELIAESNLIVSFVSGTGIRKDHVKGNIEIINTNMITYYSIEKGGMVIRNGNFTIDQIKK